VYVLSYVGYMVLFGMRKLFSLTKSQIQTELECEPRLSRAFRDLTPHASYASWQFPSLRWARSTLHTSWPTLAVDY
jgi:hypothetical protein